MTSLSGAPLYLLLIVIAMGVSVAQVMIKYAALAYRAGGSLFDVNFLIPLGTGFTISVVVQLVWLWTLQFVPLAQGYMAMALTFVFVPLVSSQLFHEPLSLRFIIGVAFIVVGVLLTVRV